MPKPIFAQDRFIFSSSFLFFSSLQEAEKVSAELRGRIGDLEKETAALISQKEALEEKINSLQDKVCNFFGFYFSFPVV